MLQVFGLSEKLAEERHSVHPSPHVCRFSYCTMCANKFSAHVAGFLCKCAIVSRLLKVKKKKKIGGKWTAVWKSALNSLLALLFSWMLCLSTVAGYYCFQSFTCRQFYQSMTQTDRGGEDNREGRVTCGKTVALFCCSGSNVNTNLRSWCENEICLEEKRTVHT